MCVKEDLCKMRKSHVFYGQIAGLASSICHT
jgi:hypothetical protein